MLEVFTNLMNLFITRTDVVMPLLWGGATAYTLWYFFGAKRVVPINPGDAKILWKLHKQGTQCTANTWRRIFRNNHVVGFECDCGHKHLQQRPVTT
jgi:hypothetical protein